MRFNGWVDGQVDSPIAAVYAMADRLRGEGGLLDLAQAAPPYPAAPEVVAHIAEVARDPRGGAYTEVPGLGKLREAFAAELRGEHGGAVEARNVMVTAGCNQAFCVAATSLAGPGDEIVLPLPYYFNHDMWLGMQGIRPVYLEPGPDLVPRAADAEALITPRTRAIVLVTPGNPGGATIESREIAAFAALARRHDLALIIDETYRSFRGADAPSHTLYADPGWEDTVVTLHSFSKDLALPGYRVGAVVASPALIRQACKLMDCAAICAPRIGQEAAWAGLTRAAAWRAERAREIASRRALLEAAMSARPGGFELLSSGGFFAWIRHPFSGRPTDEVVRDLLTAHRVLVMPGTAFLPDDRATLRVSVSNADPTAITTFTHHLHAFGT
ncbi:aspartate/methionine/tyrosine aminotransferase [Actinocorallia herbida]|uniref:Aminotransferase n=1 Tax=Actinocorallia herbida TaxID=58109 RepID=A0A3N1CU50_9ACTN|nr:aminotransferase [Actinocorallia herbida]ROO84840.1 aspartate/methionine/tyrosine aminotransferase [Actinocorallia herbida]